jgi:opacity protein-like surface antigen
MKKLIATSAIAIALAVSANSASAADFEAEQAIRGLVVGGEVESFSGVMFYGGESGDVTFDDDDVQLVSGILGRLNLPLGDNLSAQMDGEFEYTSNALSGSRQDELFSHSFLAGGHLSWRDPQSGLFGGFAAFGGGAADDNGGDGPRNFSFYAVGGEGQFYADDFTFYLQGGYIDGATDDSLPVIDSDALRDAIFGRGIVRWFMDSNTRLQAEIAYVDGESDSDADDMTIVEWGLRYDTVIPGLPILGDSNVFVGYRGAHFEKSDANNSGDDGEFVDHTIMVGFTHRFGTQTIMETDRYGATLDLPNFGRWVSAGQTLE